MEYYLVSNKCTVIYQKGQFLVFLPILIGCISTLPQVQVITSHPEFLECLFQMITVPPAAGIQHQRTDVQKTRQAHGRSIL